LDVANPTDALNVDVPESLALVCLLHEGLYILLYGFFWCIHIRSIIAGSIPTHASIYKAFKINRLGGFFYA
jgi:hypothetical protein